MFIVYSSAGLDHVIITDAPNMELIVIRFVDYLTFKSSS